MPENPLYANLEDRIDAIERLGAIWARSGAFKCDRVEQGQAILSFCIASGITPLEYLATYHNQGGKPLKLALACLAQIRMKGAKHRWLTEPDDREKAILELTYEGFTVKVKYTIEEAKAQGLIRADSAWVKSPSYMVRARAITTAIGMLAPEIVAGAEAAPDEAPLVEKSLQLDTPDKATKPDEEKQLADMGLAPAQPEKEAPKEDPPKKDPPKGKTKRKSISQIKPPGEDDGEAGEPIPPAPATLEPSGYKEEPEKPKADAKKPSPPPAPDLSPEIVNQMGHIFAGNFLNVARWMMKEGWIPPYEKELNTEAAAGAHLQRWLPRLSQEKAKKVLTKKMAFMRAVDSIEPGQ